MPGWEAIAGIGNMISGAVEGLFNPISTIINNERNIAFQKQENEITRQREDSAHQREVADLEKAGLSPLASVNGAQAQEMTAPQAEAPQMDGSALRDTMAILMQNERQKEALEEQKREHNENITHQQKLLEEQKRQFDENLKLTKDIENANIRNAIQKTLMEEQRLNNATEWEAEAKTRQSRVETAKQSEITYQELCKTWQYNFKQEICVDYVQFLQSKQQFDTQLNDFIKWFDNPNRVKKDEPNTSESGSGSLSIGLGTNASASHGETTNEYYRANQKYYQRRGKQEYNSTGSGSNIGGSASGAYSYSKDPAWTRQAQMEQYIIQYCKEKGLKQNEFLVCPIYALRDEDYKRSKKDFKTDYKWTYLQ